MFVYSVPNSAHVPFSDKARSYFQHTLTDRVIVNQIDPQRCHNFILLAQKCGVEQPTLLMEKISTSKSIKMNSFDRIPQQNPNLILSMINGAKVYEVAKMIP